MFCRVDSWRVDSHCEYFAMIDLWNSKNKTSDIKRYYITDTIKISGVLEAEVEVIRDPRICVALKVTDNSVTLVPDNQQPHVFAFDHAMVSVFV